MHLSFKFWVKILQKQLLKPVTLRHVKHCLHHQNSQGFQVDRPTSFMDYCSAFLSPMWPVDAIFVLPGVITWWLCLSTVWTHGRRASAVASQTVWNSLSDELCVITDSFVFSIPRITSCTLFFNCILVSDRVAFCPLCYSVFMWIVWLMH